MKNEKSQNFDTELVALVEKAQELKQRGALFRITRNIKNLETGEIKPGNLESGWKILNISDLGMATLFNGQNEIFHIQIKKLEKINQDLFSL